MISPVLPRRSLPSSSALIAVSLASAAPAAAEEGAAFGPGGYDNTYFGVGSIDEDSSETRDFHEAGSRVPSPGTSGN